MTTALIYDASFLEHITPENHPDKPDRLRWAMDVLLGLNWLERDGLVQLAPRAATVDELAAVHERACIRKVETAARMVAEEEKTGGRKTRFFATHTYISARSYHAALTAAAAPLPPIAALMPGHVSHSYS